MSRQRVLFLMARFGPTCIPQDIARSIANADWEVTTTSFIHAGSHLPPDTPNLHVVDLQGRSSADPRALIRLWKLIRQVRPQVLHVNHTLPAMFGALLGRLAGVPAILCTEHHDHHDIHGMRHASLWLTFLNVHRIVCNSDFTRHSISGRKKRFAQHKACTIYNGVRLEELLPATTEATNTSSRPVIGNVGRMVREKDQRSLIDAVALLRDQGVLVDLILIGDGPLHETLLQHARERNVVEQITFTGLLPRNEVYHLLPTFDLFVMCSLTEGFCNGMVEAMAAGCPVIYAKAGALPEVAGETGRGVAPQHPEELAAAIKELLDLPKEELKSMGQAGASRARDRFAMERTAASHRQLYSELLAGSAHV